MKLFNVPQFLLATSVNIPRNHKTTVSLLRGPLRLKIEVLICGTIAIKPPKWVWATFWSLGHHITTGNSAHDLSFFSGSYQWRSALINLVANFFCQGRIVFHYFTASNLMLMSELKKFEGIIILSFIYTILLADFQCSVSTAIQFSAHPLAFMCIWLI